MALHRPGKDHVHGLRLEARRQSAMSIDFRVKEMLANR